MSLRFVKKKFFLYWLDFLVALFFSAIAIICHFSMLPYDRFFLERDPFLSYPYRDGAAQEIPTSTAFVLAIPIPMLLLILWSLFWRCVMKLKTVKNDKRILDPVLALLSFLEAMALTIALTEFLKNFVGRKRPNFFAMCDYQGYRQALATGNFTFYEANTVPGRPGSLSKCFERDINILDDAQFSFPSGHSSTSFCSLTFCGLFAMETLHHFTRRNAMIKAIFVVGFVWAAAVIAGTRPRDYWHNFDDILAGAIIGFVVGTFVFQLNYRVKLVPHLLKPACCGDPDKPTVQEEPASGQSDDYVFNER